MIIKDVSLLVSCPGRYDISGTDSGGLVLIDDWQAKVIDTLDTSGITMSDNYIFRYSRQASSILGYDDKGLSFMLDLGAVDDVHDLRITNNGFICVSTGTNEVLWYDFLGKVVHSWKANGEGDAWHLNCLENIDGTLFISAFGEFSQHRGWNTQGCHECGFVLNLESQEKVLTGLSGPHSPKYHEGRWYICNSSTGTLNIYHPSQSEPQIIKLGKYTRGLAISQDHIFIGLSVLRHKAYVPGKDSAEIVVLNKNSFEVEDRLALPFCEVYDILLLDEKHAGIVRSIIQNPKEVVLKYDFKKKIDEDFQVMNNDIYALRAEIKQLKSKLYYRIENKVAKLLGRLHP